ncbi:MAG: HNH endonuclease [Acidimicrobiales bacterium]
MVEVGPVSKPRRRDPAFREQVLLAYEYRCAFCGFDGQLGREAVAIDAAHVRWWAAAGPDDVANGLALCSLHHKLFDREPWASGWTGRWWSRPISSEGARAPRMGCWPLLAGPCWNPRRVVLLPTKPTLPGTLPRFSAHRPGKHRDVDPCDHPVREDEDSRPVSTCRSRLCRCSSAPSNARMARPSGRRAVPRPPPR